MLKQIKLLPPYSLKAKLSRCIFLYTLAFLFVSLNLSFGSNDKDTIANTAPPIEKKSNSATYFKSTHTSSEFTFDKIINEFGLPTSKIIDDRNQASATFKKIEADGKWVSTFKSDDIKSLPVGVKHIINEIEYQLGFYEAKFEKNKTTLTVFARIILPQTDEKGNPIELFFGANNITLTSEGGISGTANLVLLGDFQIPFNGGSWLLAIKGGSNLKTADIQNKTYVTIDCDGVKEMGIEGEVQFSREMIIPVKPNGEALPKDISVKNNQGDDVTVPNRVKGHFNAVASDWNDLIVKIDLDPFVLTKKPDKFLFSVNTAIFDFSDIRNENVTFPQYYHDNNLLRPSIESWRGVYIKSVQISLPKEFKTKESISKKSRVNFEAADMIIDKNGISGHFSAENIIPIESGRTSDANAWSYSVDKIGINIAANNLIGADFEGQIVLPIGDSKSKGLKYFGLISEDEYLMRVANIDTLNFSIWKAQAELLPNSSIEFTVKDNNFRPKAILHGRMAISANQKESLTPKDNNTIEFKGIEFQDLVLQTESPVFSVGYFGYKDEVQLMNFPASIANIALTTNGNQAVLGFDLKINLMDKGFAADSRLEILSEFKEEDSKQRWSYKELKLRKVYLEADMGGFKMNGDLLLMENDAEYGNGFSARLDVEMASMEGIKVGAKAIFGKTTFRYWYFDVMVDDLPTGNSPTGITLKGFGGGAFYHMERTGFSSAFSPSGLAYKPNENRGLGLKAMVLFGVVNPDAIHGGAGFEILFNTNGGINKMGFYGEGHVMQTFNIPNPAAAVTGKMKELASAVGIDDLSNNKLTKQFVDRAEKEYPATISGEAGLNAYIGIEHDFENKTLHGEFDMYVNVAGNIIKGRASGGRAGWAVMHLSEEEWYLHMGTPTDRLGLIFKLGASIEAGGYFMIGDHIPGSPPPPQEVADILGVDSNSLNYMRDENALKSGKGFAFGQDFKVDTGDIKFLILYARLQAGGGYDVMLKNYGEAECSNTGDQVGINGWYANGQGYAYIQGKIGVKIKLFFKKKRIDIFKGGGAVLLQTKAPNPIWMKGYFGGKYSVLGGLIKGRFRLKVTLGEECKFEDASPINDMMMITDISPNNGAKEADVFTSPQVSFSMKINEEIVIPEDSGDKYYKVLLDKLVVTDKNNNAIKGKIEWSEFQDRVTFVPDDILPPSSDLKVIVEVSFQEKINGVFETIVEDGKKSVETKEVSFTTGGAPQTIPLQNILYCYPIIDQKNYYRKETPKGYIKLKKGQDYLFDSSLWKTEINYMEDENKNYSSVFQYNDTDNTISFPLDQVEKEKNYTISIVSSSTNQKTKTVSDKKTKTITHDLDADNTVEIQQNLSETVLKEGDLKIDRLNYSFRSSKYDTFKDKIKSIDVDSHLRGKISDESCYLTSSIKKQEPFELVELLGNQYTNNKPLIHPSATLDDLYYINEIKPKMYNTYPLYNRFYLTRDTNTLGFEPVKALHLSVSYIERIKLSSDKQEVYFPYNYYLAETYENDFYDLKKQIQHQFIDKQISPSHPSLKFLDFQFPRMFKGNYNINLIYSLPGNIKNDNTIYTFKNLSDL